MARWRYNYDNCPCIQTSGEPMKNAPLQTPATKASASRKPGVRESDKAYSGDQWISRDATSGRLLLLGAPDSSVEADTVQLIRAGLPMDAIKQVQAALDSIDVQPILDLIGMSMRTYQRRVKEAKPLTPVESDRLYRIVKIEERATDVFQDKAIATDWLSSDNRALGDKPMNLLDTEIGVEMVERELMRIEHGVFA